MQLSKFLFLSKKKVQSSVYILTVWRNKQRKSVKFIHMTWLPPQLPTGGVNKIKKPGGTIWLAKMWISCESFLKYCDYICVLFLFGPNKLWKLKLNWDSHEKSFDLDEEFLLILSLNVCKRCICRRCVCRRCVCRRFVSAPQFNCYKSLTRLDNFIRNGLSLSRDFDMILN